MAKHTIWWLGSRQPAEALIQNCYQANIGFEYINLFQIEILMLENKYAAKNVDAIYFVSKAAVDAWFKNSYRTDVDLSQLRMIATGQGTADYLLQMYEQKAEYINSYRTAEEFFIKFNFNEVNISHLVVPISPESKNKYYDYGNKYQSDLEVEELILYQKTPSDNNENLINTLVQKFSQDDYLVVTSPSNWEALVNYSSKEEREKIAIIGNVISIGPVTSRVIENDIGQIHYEMEKPQFENIIHTIVRREKEIK